MKLLKALSFLFASFFVCTAHAGSCWQTGAQSTKCHCTKGDFLAACPIYKYDFWIWKPQTSNDIFRLNFISSNPNVILPGPVIDTLQILLNGNFFGNFHPKVLYGESVFDNFNQYYYTNYALDIEGAVVSFFYEKKSGYMSRKVCLNGDCYTY